MDKEWPPQDTGLFAVPFCVQCCTYVPVDKYEIASSVNTGYSMVGAVPPDGSNSLLYRTVTWSGGFNIELSNDGCYSLEATSTVSYSGTSTANFDWTTTGVVTGVQDGNTFAEATIGNPYLAASPVSGMAENSETLTTDTWTGTGECVALGGLYNNGRTTGTATASFSNVCTEEASIAWHESTYPGWEAWSEAFMEEFWDYYWQATYAAAPAGTVGWYTHQKMKFRRTKGGFTPGVAYTCTMEVYRAPAGTYDFVLFATMETELVADATGTLAWEGETPFAREYSTWVKARSFTATPA